jgi:hypothetical protein
MLLLLATLLLTPVFLGLLEVERERTAMERFASGFLEVEDEL